MSDDDPIHIVVALVEKAGSHPGTSVIDGALDVPLLTETTRTTSHVVDEEGVVTSGCVYVMTAPAGAVAARQRTIETPNTTVVLDYDAQDELIGVEVFDALAVDWNGQHLHLHQD